jgi:predicted nucleic acid-binding protein
VNVLADTCVWSRFFRRDRTSNDRIAHELERLIRKDVLQMIGAVRQELLSGAHPSERYEQLKRYLRFFPNVHLHEEDDERAAHYYNVCRSHGIQGTPTDLLICAVAVRHRFKVFTIDNDFEGYARHLPVMLHRISG